MAFGPLLLGHRPQQVIEAVTRQISERGSQLGFPTEITIRVAEKIKQLFPSMELMRFANSGTEACASAVRLATDLHRPAQADHVRGTLSRLERGGLQSLPRPADRSAGRQALDRRSPAPPAWPTASPT